MGSFLGAVLPAGEGILKFTGSIGDWIVALDEGH